MDIETKQQLDSEAGQRVQERVQFYFVTLTFTLLALSIQTAQFKGSNISSASELFGWVFLLISGFSGLSRLYSIPSNYKISIHKNSVLLNMENALKLKHEGNETILLQETFEKVNIDGYLEQQLQKKTSLITKEATLLKKQWLLMRVHLSTLMSGLILLLIARGIDHFFTLIS